MLDISGNFLKRLLNKFHSLSSSPRTASNKCCHTPDFNQELNRLNTVFLEPNSPGKFRHGAPVQDRQRIPSIVSLKFSVLYAGVISIALTRRCRKWSEFFNPMELRSSEITLGKIWNLFTICGFSRRLCKSAEK